MPWQEVVTVELRQQFVHDARRRVVPVSELCEAVLCADPRQRLPPQATARGRLFQFR